MDLRAAVAALALALAGCSDGPGAGEPEGDLAYYCAGLSTAYCPAYLECDPFGFPQAFRSLDECVAQTERDCLEPPPGRSRCDGATVSETDGCVAYIEAHHPEGCEALFGRSADLSACESICD